MKRLINVSPFLLLLVPVFMMMLLTFTAGNTSNQDERAALRSSIETKSALMLKNNK